MNFHRSFRKCEEFKLCCAYGDKGVVYVEKHEDNSHMNPRNYPTQLNLKWK